MYSILPAVVSILFLAYGFFALFSRGINRISASFFLLCITTFFWQSTWAVLFQTESPVFAQFLVKFGYLFILFLPTSLYHFLTEICGRHEERRYVYFSYILALILAVFLLGSDLFVAGYYQYFWGYYPKAGILHPVHLLQTIVVVNRGMYITYLTQKNASADLQMRLRFCLAGILIFFFAAIDYLCNYGFEFYPPGVIFTTISWGIFTVAIVKYDLLNPMAKAASAAQEMVSEVYTSIEQRASLFEPRIFAFSITAVIAFPLYYFIWHDLFPQPYENLTLRLWGSVLFFPLMFTKYWPHWARRYLSIYWYLATLYALPFFFTFMLLSNNGSTVWLLSTLIAVFLMILLLDWLTFLIQLSLGICLAWLAYYTTTGIQNVGFITWEALPIYLFAIILGSIANYSAEMLKKERMRALATASNMAHELRTTLLGIKSGAAGLQRYLPALLEAYRLAQERGILDQPIRLAHLHSMHGVLERIKGEADHSNIIIDMLLMNTRLSGFKPESFSTCSISQCVEAALLRYPFASDKERHSVVWNRGVDFNFHGIELLMVHVLFNLIKNSLYHIARVGKGGIFVHLETTAQGNALIFRDTGSGIPPEILPNIFTHFYSWSPDNDSGLGAGIGLAFCRSVMNSFGGSIRCKSQLGDYTEFILTFPSQPGQAP